VTTHPIAAHVESTGVATDNFDGISYGKGACFLHQLVFFFGEGVLKEGLKTYFKKYAFKNTVAADFMAEMSAAATKLELNEVNMEAWAAEWLNSSGCSAISIQPECDNGTISKLTVVQDLYSPEPKNEQNILRT